MKVNWYVSVNDVWPFRSTSWLGHSSQTLWKIVRSQESNDSNMLKNENWLKNTNVKKRHVISWNQVAWYSGKAGCVRWRMLTCEISVNYTETCRTSNVTGAYGDACRVTTWSWVNRCSNCIRQLDRWYYNGERNRLWRKSNPIRCFCTTDAICRLVCCWWWRWCWTFNQCRQRLYNRNHIHERQV